MSVHQAAFNDDQLTDLIVRYLDSDLLPDDVEQLRSRLSEDAHSRDVFVEVCLQAKLCAETLANRLHDVSGRHAELPAGETIPIEQPASSPVLGFLAATIRSTPGGEVIVGLLVIFAVVAATWGLLRLRDHLGGSGQRHSLAAGGFAATLTVRDNCRFRKTDLSVERAARLQTGQLELESGVAEVTFDCGARVVLEGPALLELESSSQAHLAFGRLVAYVPPTAHGFTVTCPSVTVVDLGTEFGLDVDATGTAELQVFQGKVEARPTAIEGDSRPLVLEVAGAARFNLAQGRVKSSPAQPVKFVRRVEQRMTRPALALVEEGGRIAPGNLTSRRSAWAFGKNVLPGYPQHRIDFLIDGRYGNNYSWIGAEDGPTFAGVALGEPCRIDSIAFGRDNEQQQQAGGGLRDRWQGSYTIQYTAVDRPDGQTAETDWQTIDTVKYAPDMPEILSEHIRPYLRHRFRFAPVRATAVRIVTSEGGICIDELEVYGSPLSETAKK